MAPLCIEIFIWLDGLAETLHLMMLDWYVHTFVYYLLLIYLFTLFR